MASFYVSKNLIIMTCANHFTKSREPMEFSVFFFSFEFNWIVNENSIKFITIYMILITTLGIECMA